MDEPHARVAALEHAVAFLLAELAELRYPDRPSDVAREDILKDLQVQPGIFDHALGSAVGQLANKARSKP